MTFGDIAPIQPRDAVSRPRFALVDVVRGAAILGVVFYHLFWDLSYYWLIPFDVSTHPVWVAFARGLLGSFLFLTGIALVLAHRRGIRWAAFWKRFGVIAGAASLVTIGTYVAFADTFVYFGVLHAIALFSLLGLPFLRLRAWQLATIGLLIIILAFAVSLPGFTAKPLSWIGFWDVPPPTNDLVPLFPWFGVTLLGMASTRLVLESQAASHWLAGWSPGSAFRWLARVGRWTLVIYLVHQPVLLAGIYPLATFVFQETTSANSFAGTCQAGCINTGSDPGYCERYCSCAMSEIVENDMWDAVEALEPTSEQNKAVTEMILQCSADADILP